MFTHILEMNESGASAIEGILDTGALPQQMRDKMSGESREGLRSADDYWRSYETRREALLMRALRGTWR